MKRFFRNRNNGTVAVISEEDAKLYKSAADSDGDPAKLGVKVFTFCSPERMASQEDAKHIFTGDYDFLNKLMADNEFVDHQGFGGWSGYVPFSNHTEEQRTEAGLPTKGAQEQLLHRTTAQDVVDAFMS